MDVETVIPFLPEAFARASIRDGLAVDLDAETRRYGDLMQRGRLRAAEMSAADAIGRWLCRLGR